MKRLSIFIYVLITVFILAASVYAASKGNTTIQSFSKAKKTWLKKFTVPTKQLFTANPNTPRANMWFIQTDMFPFQTMGTFRIFLGNVTVCVNHMFALGVLGFAIKSCLVATVYLLYQDFFRFAEGLYSGVAFGSCVDWSGECENCDQDVDEYW